MHFDFMTPDIWDGLVAGTVLIGLSLATLRIMQDRARYKRQQSRPGTVTRQKHNHQ
jgi:hypothetical protein